MTELLACLGQEGAKIEALSQLLIQKGMDEDSIQAILDEVSYSSLHFANVKL